MKIGLVAPSPVPFAVGGAENLFWGLQDYLNLETSHQCELLKLPSRETNLWEIIDSYERFLQLDLSYFDLLISTKYPAWMVSHPRHVCYMQHTLRGLYDTYHFTRQSEAFSWDAAPFHALNPLKERIKSATRDSKAAVLEFLGAVRQLQNTHLPEDTFRFPGPFSRAVVHLLDGYGLAPTRIANYAAISANVRGRAGYFPAGVDVSVIPHPPRLTGYRCGGDDYLFTVSRLDGPKRIRLLVEAMRHVKSNISLLIAGTGPDEQQLRTLACDDQRIRFLGFVRDEEVLRYYSDALAVPYVPYDEDYGLITIEAMKSGKPVLTSTDSGGPNEFVRSGETGYSVPPEPDKLAERIDYLCSHRGEARAMGKTARDLVRNISWNAVVDGLLPRTSNSVPAISLPCTRRARKKLVVTTTFPVFPPLGGGQTRIYHLYRYLAHSFDIDIISLCNRGDAKFDEYIAPGLREIRVPKSQTHHTNESSYSESVGWVPVTDIMMPVLYKDTPAYSSALTSASRDAFAVVASHPYTIEAIQQCAPGVPVWFEAHNVEYTLKRDVLPETERGRRLLELVRETEGRAWTRCEIAYACTQFDLDQLSSLYGSKPVFTAEVPNGVCFDEVLDGSESTRVNLKRRLGLGDRKVVLFMGSWHGPNISAAEFTLELAQKLPGVLFVVLGSAGSALQGRTTAANVLLTGAVADAEKSILLSAADIAINPMTAGSGSNLKMLDYAAAGLPILSTPFGARGLDFVAGTHYLAAELERFPLELTAALATESARSQVAAAAKELAASRYSWRAIASQFSTRLAERSAAAEMPLQVNSR